MNSAPPPLATPRNPFEFTVLAVLLLLSGSFLLRSFADLLVRFPRFAVGLVAYAVLTVGGGVLVWRAALRNDPLTPGRAAQALLLAALPLAFLGDSLSCTGLRLRGCSPFCGWIKLVWVPVMAGAALLCYLKPGRGPRLTLACMALLPLWPHCICRNPANAFWIRTFGASPACYALGGIVSGTALSGLLSGRRLALALAVCYSGVLAALFFFIGHHYFRFPW